MAGRRDIIGSAVDSQFLENRLARERSIPKDIPHLSPFFSGISAPRRASPRRY